MNIHKTKLLSPKKVFIRIEKKLTGKRQGICFEQRVQLEKGNKHV